MSIAANFSILNVHIDVHANKKFTELLGVISRIFKKSKVLPKYDLELDEFC